MSDRDSAKPVPPTFIDQWVARDSVLERIARNPGLFQRLLEKRPQLAMILADPLLRAELVNMIGVGPFIDTIGLPRVVEALTHDGVLATTLPAILNAVDMRQLIEHVGLAEIVKYIELQELLHTIKLKALVDAAGPKAVLEHIHPPDIVKHVDVKDLLQNIKLKTLVDTAGPKAVLEYIRVSEIVEHVGMEKLFKAIPIGEMVRAIGPKRLLEEIPLDQLVPRIGTEKILEHIKLKNLVAAAGVDAVLEHIRVPDIVKHFGADELLRAIPFAQIMTTLGTKKILDSIPSNTLIERLSSGEVLAQVPVKKLVDAAGPRNVIEHLTIDERLHGLDMADHRVLDAMLSDPHALAKLLSDDRAVRATLVHEQFRKRSRAIDGYRVAGKLSYALPIPVVSFPRAGSNFMQMVLQASCGLRCQSIYVPLDDPAEVTLTVKSHGPSPEYLADEWRRFLPDLVRPAKAIVLRRDPRDLMISFLEYTRNRRQCEIDPGAFLDGVDYFFASTIDRNFQRRLYLNGLTIAEAFSAFVDTWVCTPPQDIEILQVRYEDLVSDPRATFKTIFDFLALDCELAMEAMGNKISQYGDSGGRERGVVRGWEKHYAKYAALVDQVNAKLAGELRTLGYEAS